MEAAGGNIFSSILSVFMAVLMSFSALPLGPMFNNAQNWDKDQIAEERVQEVVDYFDAVLEHEIGSKWYFTEGGGQHTSTEDIPAGAEYIELDFSSVNNILYWAQESIEDESKFGGDIANFDFSALENKTMENTAAIDILYAVFQFLADNGDLISKAITKDFDFGKLKKVFPEIFADDGIMGTFDLYEVLMYVFGAYNRGADNITLTTINNGTIVLAYRYEETEGQCLHPEDSIDHYWYWEEWDSVWNEETEVWEEVIVARHGYCYVPLTDEEKSQFNADNVLIKAYQELLYSIMSSFGVGGDAARDFANSINAANSGAYAIIPQVLDQFLNLGSNKYGDTILQAIREFFIRMYGVKDLSEDLAEDDIRRIGIYEGTEGYDKLLSYYNSNFKQGDYSLFDYNLTIDGVAYKMFAASYKEDGSLVFYPYEESIKGKEIADVIDTVFDLRFALPSDYQPQIDETDITVTADDGTRYYISPEGDVYKLLESVFPASEDVSAATIASLTDEYLVADKNIYIFSDDSVGSLNVDKLYFKDNRFYTKNVDADNNAVWQCWTLESETTFYRNINDSLAAVCGCIDPYFVFNDDCFNFIDNARELGGGFVDQLNNVIATIIDFSWTDAAKAEFKWVAGGNDKLNENILGFIRFGTGKFLTEGTSADLTSLFNTLADVSGEDGIGVLKDCLQFFDAEYYKNATLETIAIDILCPIVDVGAGGIFTLPDNIDSLEAFAACILTAFTDVISGNDIVSSFVDADGLLVAKTQQQWKEITMDAIVELLLRLLAETGDENLVIFTNDEIDIYKNMGWGYLDFLDELFDRFYVYIEGLVAGCDDLGGSFGIVDGNGPWYKMSKLLNTLLPLGVLSDCAKTYGDETFELDIGVLVEDGIIGNLLDLDLSGLLGILAANKNGTNPFYGNNLVKTTLVAAQHILNSILPGAIADEDIVSLDHLITDETLAKVAVQLINALNERKTELVPFVASFLELAGIFEMLPIVDNENGFVYYRHEDADGKYLAFAGIVDEREIREKLVIPSEYDGMPVKGYEASSFSIDCPIVLPETMEYFEFSDYYYGDYAYNTYEVSDNHKYFKVYDGVLFDKEMTTIIAYPANKTDATFIVPSTVKAVYAVDFSENDYLETLILSEGTEEIQNTRVESWYTSMFNYNLREIYIPSSVSYIHEDVFGYNGLTIYGTVNSYAYEYYCNVLSGRYGFAFEVYYPDYLYVTLSTEKQAVKSNIYVYGYAQPGSKIYVYDGDHLIGNNEQMKSDKYAKWEANVPLYNPVDTGSYHDITVVAEKDGERVTSNKITVYYEKNAIVFKEFKMVHYNCYNVTINDATSNRTVKNMTWIPSEPTADFRVRILNSNKLAEVYLESTVNGRTERVSLQRAEKDYWVASDGFLGDPPGDIRIYGVVKKGFETIQIGPDIRIHFLIDPSGNIYEFNNEHPLEGVKATVQYLNDDGEFVDWDAEAYEQVNPIITDISGGFKWIVPRGQWRVVCEKEGYETYTSYTYNIPPEVTGLEYYMETTEAPVVKESYFENGVVTITYSQYMNLDYLDEYNYSIPEAAGFTVETADEADGYYTHSYYVENIEGYKTVKIYCYDSNDNPLAKAPVVTINNERNYAGIKIAANTVVEPVDLTKNYGFTVVADKDEIVIGDVVTLTVALAEGSEKIDTPVEVIVSNKAIFDNELDLDDDGVADVTAEIPETITFDENGKATLTLIAGFNGSTEVSFKAAGKTETVNITINKAAETEHVHAYGELVKVESTCLKAGYEYQECECGDVLYTAYDLADHTKTEIVNENTLRSEASCRACETYYYTCGVCQDILTEGEFFTYGTMEKHDLKAPVEETVGGVTYSVISCKNCIYMEREVISTGCEHAEVKEITVAATCTQSGYEGRIVCANPECNKVINEGTILPAAHKEVVLEGTAPTCTETGLTEGKMCSVCGTVLVEQTVVPTAGHDYVSEVTIPATHFADGVMTYICICGDTYTEVISKTDAHTYEFYDHKEATCTEEGVREYYCECGHTYSEIISSTDHIDENSDGECDNCGNVNCDHICHKSGFMGFIWKIILTFLKLFGVSPVCECGAAHY